MSLEIGESLENTGNSEGSEIIEGVRYFVVTNETVGLLVRFEAISERDLAHIDGV